METIKDIFLVYGRIITIIPLLLFVTLIMGRRSIGELPVFDFIIIIVLGSVVGADIADPSVHHLPTVGAVLGIAILQIIIAKLTISKRWFGRIITFEPTIVVRNGEFIVGNMRRVRYTLDNILQMLRENDIFDVSSVELAIVEGNGNLSVHKKEPENEGTEENLDQNKNEIAYPVLVEGTIYSDILSQLNLDENWLQQQLESSGLKKEDIFFASVTPNNVIHLSVKNNKTQSPPEFLH